MAHAMAHGHGLTDSRWGHGVSVRAKGNRLSSGLPTQRSPLAAVGRRGDVLALAREA